VVHFPFIAPQFLSVGTYFFNPLGEANLSEGVMYSFNVPSGTASLRANPRGSYASKFDTVLIKDPVSVELKMNRIATHDSGSLKSRGSHRDFK
jgi:hypothetical protein